MAPEVGAGRKKPHGKGRKGVGFGAHTLSVPCLVTVVTMGVREGPDRAQGLFIPSPARGKECGLPSWAGPF